MAIRLICLGKLKNQHFLQEEGDYIKRINAWVNFKLQEVDNKKLRHSNQKEEEGKQILEELKAKDYVIALDQSGKQFSSEKLSEFLVRNLSRNLVFLIGSEVGFADAIKKRADFTLSLSELTLTYTHTRLILLEQIYRALSIMRGTAYHK